MRQSERLRKYLRGWNRPERQKPQRKRELWRKQTPLRMRNRRLPSRTRSPEPARPHPRSNTQTPGAIAPGFPVFCGRTGDLAVCSGGLMSCCQPETHRFGRRFPGFSVKPARQPMEKGGGKESSSPPPACWSVFVAQADARPGWAATAVLGSPLEQRAVSRPASVRFPSLCCVGRASRSLRGTCRPVLPSPVCAQAGASYDTRSGFVFAISSRNSRKLPLSGTCAGT